MSIRRGIVSVTLAGHHLTGSKHIELGTPMVGDIMRWREVGPIWTGGFLRRAPCIHARMCVSLIPPYGSVRGAVSDGRPHRDTKPRPSLRGVLLCGGVTLPPLAPLFPAQLAPLPITACHRHASVRRYTRNVPKFVKSVLIDAPVARVFGFHEREDALQLLTPHSLRSR